MTSSSHFNSHVDYFPIGTDFSNIHPDDHECELSFSGESGLLEKKETYHPYPMNEFKGRNITHVGTGRVARIDIADEQQGNEVCQCSTCEASSTPNTVKVYV
ncbi:hypothetical protein Bpfe_002658 [Biomphalaria pfeifferi]|uniref:Uncharacterized protein n=1 Tax=Biomphalaria pfeifferi TaxID=112525 RepID=A0AAD8FK02_BIOPF|nr:hypothetical protein Bpfe_002658 [Biomphalaria pfeifferi]